MPTKRHPVSATARLTTPDSSHIRDLTADARPLDPRVLTWANEVQTTPREKATLVAIAGHPGCNLAVLQSLTCMGSGAIVGALRDLINGGLVYPVEGGFAVLPHTDLPEVELSVGQPAHQ